MMRGLEYDGQALRYRTDLPRPTANSDQALLRIRLAGICNTDLEIIRGYTSFRGILGHEFVADVISGPEHLLGRRVVGEINVADGTCDFCRRGIPSQCLSRSTVGIRNHPGAFAEYLALAAVNLHVIPNAITDEQAVFIEPLAAALQVTEMMPIHPSDRVAVVGAGKLGLLVCQVLKLSGADLVAVVRHEEQAELLKGGGIPSARLEMLTPQSMDVVIDCTGTETGFSDVLKLVRSRGRIILKSTYAGLSTIDLTQIAVREITVIGSRCGPFAAAIRLMEHGLIDTASLITDCYPLEQGETAFQRAGERGVRKILLKP